MKTYLLTVTSTPSSLYDLLATKEPDHLFSNITLQAVSGTVNFGSESSQPFVLLTTAPPLILPENSTKNIYVSASNKTLAVGLS